MESTLPPFPLAHAPLLPIYSCGAHARDMVMALLSSAGLNPGLLWSSSYSTIHLGWADA